MRLIDCPVHRLTGLLLRYCIMKKIISIVLVLAAVVLFSCTATGKKYDIEITSPLQSDSIYLGRYYLGKVHFIDSLKLNKGVAHFKGNKPLKEGVYLLVFPDGNYVDMLVGDKQNFKVNIDTTNMPFNVKFEAGSQQEAFYNYSMEYFEMKRRFRELGGMAIADTTAEGHAKYEAEAKSIVEKQKHLVDSLKAKFPGKMISVFVGGMDVPEPEPIKVPENCTNPDSLQRAYYYAYFRDNFFDNIDLGDERSYYTPYIGQRLEMYLNRILVQKYDSIVPQAMKLYERSSVSDSAARIMANYLVAYTTRYDIPGFFEERKIMGLDNIMVELADRYYQTDKTIKADSIIAKKVIEKANKIRNCMVGDTARNIPVATLDGEYHRLYDLSGSDYTIFVLYEPDCDHCKVRLPKVAEFCKIPALQGKVKGVALCMTDDKAKMEQFISEHGTANLTNVWDPDRISEYWSKYDTSETPMIVVVDKDHRIVARNIEPEQLFQWIKP